MKRLAALLVGLALIMVAGTSQALTLRISDGFNTQEITSGTGVAVFQGSIGAYLINVTTGLSKPVLGSAAYPWMDLNSVDVSTSINKNAGKLTISLTDTGFTGAVPGFDMNFGGTTGGTVNYKAYYDTSNAAFGVGNLIGDLTAATSPFALETALNGTPSSIPYSLTQIFEITHGAGTVVTSFDAELIPTPEPGTIILLGAGLLGLGLYGRKRIKR